MGMIDIIFESCNDNYISPFEALSSGNVSSGEYITEKAHFQLLPKWKKFTEEYPDLAEYEDLMRDADKILKDHGKTTGNVYAEIGRTITKLIHMLGNIEGILLLPAGGVMVGYNAVKTTAAAGRVAAAVGAGAVNTAKVGATIGLASAIWGFILLIIGHLIMRLVDWAAMSLNYSSAITTAEDSVEKLKKVYSKTKDEKSKKKIKDLIEKIKDNIDDMKEKDKKKKKEKETKESAYTEADLLNDFDFLFD